MMKFPMKFPIDPALLSLLNYGSTAPPRRPRSMMDGVALGLLWVLRAKASRQPGWAAAGHARLFDGSAGK